MLLVFMGFSFGCKPGYVKRTKKFAATVKSTVNPDQLQSWATNVLGTASGDVDVTNVPNFVLSIYKDDPPEWVQIQHDDSGRYIEIGYGSGFGHWGIYAGCTNLEIKGDERFYVLPWKPGIYFWSGP
jgi:hypothetical protein